MASYSMFLVYSGFSVAIYRLALLLGGLLIHIWAHVFSFEESYFTLVFEVSSFTID